MNEPCDTPREYDLSAGDCRTVLSGLFNAALAITTSNARVRVRIGDRWTDYAKPNYEHLVQLYGTIRNQCPEGDQFPDLSSGMQVRRGPPGQHVFVWPTFAGHR